MKKILMIITISVLALIVLCCAGLFIFIKTFDANRYRPQIVDAARQALGRPVSLGNIALQISLTSGIRLHVDTLAIGEDPRFGKEYFFTAEGADVAVSVTDLLFARRVNVLEIGVHAPRLAVVRLKDGSVNLQSLGAKASAQSSVEKKGAGVAGAAIPALFFKHITIDRGEIRYQDQILAPGAYLEIKQILFTIDDFSLTQPFTMSFAAACAREVPDIHFSGTGKVDPARGTFALTDAAFSLDISTATIDMLRKALPQLSSLPAFDKLSGTLTAAIRRCEAGAQGIAGLDADIGMKDVGFSVQDAAPGVSLSAEHLNASITKLSLTDACPFKVEGAYLGSEPDISMAGKIRFDAPAQGVVVQDISVDADLAKMSLPELAASVAALKNVPLPQELKGALHITLESVSAGARGVGAFTAIVGLKDGFARLKELPSPLEKISAQVTVNGSDILLDRCVLSLGTGSIAASGELRGYASAQAFTAKIEPAGIDLKDCVDMKKMPVACAGRVSGTLSVAGRGFDPATLPTAITGTGALKIADGKLIDMNVLKMVLDKISFVPNLGATVSAGLPERYKTMLQQKDTPITSAQMNFSLANGSLTADQIAVDAGGFVFNGSGKANIDQSYVLNGTFVIPQDLAASIVTDVPQMNLLQDEQKEIRFPLSVSGKGAAVTFMPDIGEIAGNAIKNKGVQELGRLLGKALGTGGGQEPAAGAGSEQSSAAAGQENATTGGGELIENVLGSIFKK
ncbi:MAG: AsmA family protein [Candidatus Omnitrophota bacterium]